MKKDKLIKVNDIWLTLHNYKEPMKKINKKDGFGFYGCLLATPDGKYVQCHFCGELYSNLGKHITQAHPLTISEYKERYQLAKKTALCSEEFRIATKLRYLKWWKSLSKIEQEAYRRQWKTSLKEYRKLRGTEQPKITLETKNKRGTCPDQLLDKIKEVAKNLGHTPSKCEFIEETESQRYIHLIYTVFGSWKKALKLCKLQPKEKYENGGFRNYTDDELLEYLRVFAQENNKVPTYTDFNRGLLPSYQVYTKRFGGIENARQLANVYQFIET